jgi:hypothetical protein
MTRIIKRNLLPTFNKVHSISVTYISGLMFRKATAVYCKTQTKDTDTPCGRNIEPLDTKSWAGLRTT